MKKSYYCLCILFIVCIANANGQENLKLGHIDTQEILQKLPATDSIQNILTIEAVELEEIYNEMLNEYQTSIEEFQNEESTYNEFVRNTRQKELIDSETKIQQFRQDANQQLQKRQLELFSPVNARMNKAIEKISLENKFTYVLDLSSGSVAFYSPTSENLTPLVLGELGVK